MTEKIGDKIEEVERPFVSEEEKLKSYILNSMDKFMRQRRAFETRWRDADAMSHGKSVGHYYKGQSKVTVPLVHNAIRSVSSKLRDVLWGRRVNFDMLPTKGVLGEEGEANKNYICYQLGHLGQQQKDFYNIFYDFVWQVCTFGKSYLKQYWMFEVGKQSKRIWRTVAKRDKFGKLISVDYKPIDVKIDTTLYDNLMIENPNIFDIYIDSTISDLSFQPIIIHRQFVPWRKILAKHNKGIYKNINPEVHKNWKRPAGAFERDYSRMILERRKGIEGQGVERSSDDEYELLESYLWYADKDGEERFSLATLLVGGNDAIVIQHEEFPYMHGQPPIVDANLEKDLFIAYGLGIPDLCRESQIEANDNRRQIMDAKTFALNNMWLWDTSSGIAPNYLYSEPAKVISTTNISGLKQLTIDPSLISMGIAAEKLSVDTIRETSMSPASDQGLPTRYGTTATEASQILTQSNISIVDVAKNIEKSAIEPMLRQVHSLNRQFIVKEQVVFVLGKAGLPYPITIKPWEMQEDVNFVATGSLHMNNKVLVAQQMINMLNSNFAQQLPPGTLKLGNTLRLIYEGWDVPNSEMYINYENFEPSEDPINENIMLNQGQRVEVKKADRDLEHIITHMAGGESASPDVQKEYELHIKDHEASYRKKTAEQEQMMIQSGQAESLGKGTNQMPKTQIGMLRQTEKMGMKQTNRGLIS